MYSSVVIDLLTGHNTLIRHLHLMGLTNNPLSRRRGAEDETSAHILCKCEALASLRHVYLGSFLDPEVIKSLSLGTIWNFSKGTGFPRTGTRLWGTKGLFLRPRCIGTIKVQTQMLINHSVSHHLQYECEVERFLGLMWRSCNSVPALHSSYTRQTCSQQVKM